MKLCKGMLEEFKIINQYMYNVYVLLVFKGLKDVGYIFFISIIGIVFD